MKNLLLTCLLASASTLHGDDAPDFPRCHELSLQTATSGAHHLTPVEIEGRRFDFLVDTGADVEVAIDKQVAEKLGKDLEANDEASPIGGKVNLFRATFDSIHIGSAIKWANREAMVADLPEHLDALVPEGATFGGLLGSRFFARTRAVISYPDSVMRIPPPGVESDAFRKAALAAGYWTLPLTLDAKGRPFLKVRLGGKDFSFLVDTAAGREFLDPEVVSTLGLETRESSDKVKGGGPGQVTDLSTATTGEMVVGDRLVLPSHEFLVMANHAGTRSPDEQAGYGGIIGRPLLEKLGASLDFGSRSLLMAPVNSQARYQSLLQSLEVEAEPDTVSAGLERMKELAAAGARKAKPIDLSGLGPDSTEEEVREALRKSGAPVTDAAVRQALSVLEGTKGSAGSTALALPTDATEADVRKAMKDAGIEVTDERVAATMATLRAASPPDPLDLEAGEGIHRLTLETGANGKHQWFVPATIDGHETKLLLDSGAESTTLATEALADLGLRGDLTGAESRGIDKAADTRNVTLKSFAIGEASAEDVRLRANSLHSNEAIAGLLGTDFLRDQHAVLDLRNHRMSYRDMGKVDLDRLPDTDALGKVTLDLKDGRTLLEATLDGKPVRFLLDTGANVTLLDRRYVEASGARIVGSTNVLRGVGGVAEKQGGVATFGTLEIGPATVKELPVMIQSLAGLQQPGKLEFDGILGADVLVALRPVIDFGDESMRVAPGEVDMRLASTIGGLLLGSDQALAGAVDDGAFVGIAKIVQCALYKKGQKRPGTPDGMRALDVTFEIEHVSRGDSGLLGKTVVLHYYLPEYPYLDEDIAGSIRRSARRILVGLPDQEDSRLIFDEAVWTAGAIAIDQIERVME